MVEEYDLGDTSWMSNEEIGEAILESVRENRGDPNSFVYRGFNCDEEKLERVKLHGTDRTTEGWEAAAKRLLVEFDDKGFTREEALRSTKPDRIYAATARNIEDAIESADDSTDGFPVVAVYRADQLQRMTGIFSENQEYKFRGEPSGALDSVYRFSF